MIGRILAVAVAGLLFVGVLASALKGPKWTGSAENIGYYGGLALFLLLGVFILFLPSLLAPRPLPRRAEGSGHPDQPTEYVSSPFAGPALIALGFAILAWPLFHWNRIADGVRGPQPISNAELAATSDHNTLSTRWVIIRSDGSFDPDIVEVRTRRRATPITIRYLLLKVGDKYLISSDRSDLPHNGGYLSSAANGDWWRSGATQAQQIRHKYPQLAPNILPYEYYRDDDMDVRIACFGPLVVTLVFAIPCFLLAWSVMANRRRKLNAPPDLGTTVPGKPLARPYSPR